MVETRCGTLTKSTDEHSPERATTEPAYGEELANTSQFREPQTSALPGLQTTQPAQPRKSPGKPKHAPANQRPNIGFHAHRRSVPRHAPISDRTYQHLSWHALSHPDFRLYFIGTVTSNLGTWLQNTAQALLAYQLTHSVLAIGGVVCAQFSWVLLLGPWAGKKVSRTPSVQRLLIITQVASAAVAAFMAVLQGTGHLTVGWLIAGALGLGLAYCFTLPATSVLIPALVHENEIQAAVALDSTSYNIGRCVAPLFAVLIVTHIGFSLAFALNAVSFLALVAALAKTRPVSVTRNMQAKITDGFRVASKQRKILYLLIIVAAVTVTADPVLVLGPALARHFHMPETWAGYFLSALGAGSILGSFVPMRRRLSKVRQAAYPLFLLGAAIAVFALGFNRWLSLVAAAVAGATCLVTNSAAKTLLWNLTPKEEERASVMAIWAVAWAGSKPLASLVDGVLATFIGAWAAGALPSTLKLPSVQTAGVLLAIPALIPALVAWFSSDAAASEPLT